jgi:ATP-dependent helicase HrpB
MAQAFGEEVGGRVGYRIRFETRVSARTRIEIVTEGILTRRLQADPALEDVGLVIFDEFHERHLQTDLGLALVRDSQRLLRPDLKILVMSATLDGAAVARLLEAPLVTAGGRAYPVEVRYAAREPEGPLAQRAAQAARAALAAHRGDLLVFLPGAAEIRDAAARLAGADAEILPLYGDLGWEAQQRALAPARGRKVVLATPIAETSLTIEGIEVVIDVGYTRVPQFDPASGLTRLVTTRVARAAAEQRAGRAGRTGPGVCYRLWTESVDRGLAAQPLPEIRTADLAGLVLELALWGARDPGTLVWLDPPPRAAVEQARELLADLGALDAQGQITALGRDMAALPLHPRLAHLVRVAAARGRAALGCDLAALLSERDLYPAEARATVDLHERLEALAAFRERGPAGARAHGADPGACARVAQASRQWRRLIAAPAERREDPAADLGALVAAAYPERVAGARAPNATRYVLASGRGARLPPYEARLRAPYLAIAYLQESVRQPGMATAAHEGGEPVIHLAAPIALEAIREMLAHRLVVEETVRWDEASQGVVARREERLGRLVLDSAPAADPPPDAVRAAMLAGIRRLGIGALPWSAEARRLQARIASMRAWFPEEGWPDLSDAALLARLDEWLGPWLDGCTRREHLARLDLLAALQAQLAPPLAARLREGAPSHLTVPSGSRLALEYRPGESPVLAVKLQEMFGLADTPRVAFGRVPVTLHLLSPARRPIQVTQDLRGFWERTYKEVRKELKGRYPKHPWPDDPWQARPTSRARQRR